MVTKKKSTKSRSFYCARCGKKRTMTFHTSFFGDYYQCPHCGKTR